MGSCRDHPFGTFLNVYALKEKYIVLQFYDTVINLSDEIDTIWLQHWSMGKIMYIVSRYTGFLDAGFLLWYSFPTSLTTESCRNSFDTSVWSITIGISICHVVLVIRTFALWERNIIVLAYVCLIEIVGFVSKIIVLDQALKSAIFIPSPSPTVAPCIYSLQVDKIFVNYFIDMAFELNILFLSLYKGVHQWRRNLTPVIRTLYRDGFICFTILFFISLANTIVTIKMPRSPYASVLIGPSRFFHSILASRVILNLRKADVVTGNETSMISTVNFWDMRTRSINFAHSVHSDVGEE